VKARIHKINWDSEGWNSHYTNPDALRPARRIIEMEVLADVAELQEIDPTKPITITQEVEEDD